MKRLVGWAKRAKPACTRDLSAWARRYAALPTLLCYGYDAYGNKTSTTTSGGLAGDSSYVAPRTGSASYDSQGQFATQQTNALGQSESWQYEPRFGKPTSHTGPNGLTTTWQYDSLGRKTREVRPDGTQTTWSYYQCAPNACPANVSYVIYEFLLDSQGNQNGPYTEVHFDMLDRELYHYTQVFDGRYTTLQTIYDGLGRVQQKSRPYYSHGATPQWTRFEYDALGRVITEYFPDSSTRQHDYHGLVTTDHDSYQRRRTVTRNSQGQPILVQEKDPYDTVLTSTSFTYDPFGNVLTTTDTVGNVVTNAYDARGRKTASNDPDLGNWTYAYDALSEVVGQTDAKLQHTTLKYDLLGRLIERDEPDMIGCWAYGTAAPAIGKLVAASVYTAAGCQSPLTFQRSYVYDSLGRPTTVGSSTPDWTINAYAGYDSNSRLSLVVYPSGFAVTYSYNSFGFLQQLSDARSPQVFWTANARDAELHLTQDTVGNGVATSRTFDPTNGRLTNIRAGTNNSVLAADYSYDLVGKLTNRTDYNDNITEDFTYDWLYRVASSQVKIISTQAITASNAFSYDPIGNLVSKTGVGNYAYPAAGQLRPHAVTSISGGAINTTFTYDNNGNQTSGLGRTVSYASYNKPASITQGSAMLSFADDADHQRYKQTTPEGTIYYFDAFGVHEEINGASWDTYLMIGGTMVGMRVLHPDSSVTLRYFHQDHLGSIAVITDENGLVQTGHGERNSYDVWGKRRFADGHDDPSGSLNTSSQTIRGFTGEEFLGDVGLVHLNGRVYDPLIARMLSADPVVGDPMNGQTWNRYSYVYNTPLTLTDPSGYCPWSACIGYAVPPRVQGATLRLLTDVLRTAVVAACVALPTCQPFAPVFAGVTSSFSTVINGGDLKHALVSGAVSGATALAFQAVGDITSHMPGAQLGPNGTHGTFGFGSPGHLANIAGHALVGCGSAAATGGKCGAGALSGAVPAFAGPVLYEPGVTIRGLVANAALSGLASVAGGGKFANGAITGAFGYLFNATSKVGVAIEIPGLISTAITNVVNWFNGDERFVMPNGVEAGVVFQWPGNPKTDQDVKYDLGVYGQYTVAGGDLQSVKVTKPLQNVSGAFEFGLGKGDIHGTFDGPSIVYGANVIYGGASITQSQGSWTALSVKVGPGLGISANYSYTASYTLRDLFR